MTVKERCRRYEGAQSKFHVVNAMAAEEGCDNDEIIEMLRSCKCDLSPIDKIMFWTDAKMREAYKMKERGVKVGDIAKHFNRPENSVYQAIYKYKYRLSKRQLQSGGEEN